MGVFVQAQAEQNSLPSPGKGFGAAKGTMRRGPSKNKSPVPQVSSMPGAHEGHEVIYCSCFATDFNGKQRITVGTGRKASYHLNEPMKYSMRTCLHTALK